MKSSAGERRAVERELETFRITLDKTALALVETLELLEGFLDAMGDGGCGDLGEALRISLRVGWEQLEAMGFELEGKAHVVFDPTRHRIIKEECESVAREKRVSQIVNRGIRYRGRQIRPANVVVGVKGE
jgi:molecular chaperone GrpE (heat shock protein)